MKKVFLSVILLVLGCLFLTACGEKSAESQENEKRFITVINKTKQVINELTITVDGGTEIVFVENWDEKSESFEIPEEYAEHIDFTVTLVDPYKGVYEKEVTIEDEKGRHEVTVKKSDMTEEGDVISRKLNGD